METAIGLLLGALASWLITFCYYRKSSNEVPEWFKPILKKLPPEKPSRNQLLKLFQDALNEGEVSLHPLLGHVACPDCKAPLEDLEEKVFGDDNVTLVSVKCPHCGWEQTEEVG